MFLTENNQRNPAADAPAPPATSREYRAPDVLDRVGATASLLCAIHCAALPLVVTLLPLVGLQFLAEEWVEWLLVGAAAAVGITSLCFGYREHRSRRALGVLGVGLTLIFLGRILEKQDWPAWGVPILVLGGVTVAGAHVFNQILCRACRSCHPK
jgi:hypothetical protein